MSLKEEQVSIKQDPQQEERQHDQFNDVQIKQESQDHDGVDSQYTNGTQNDDSERFEAAESDVKVEPGLGMGITSSQSEKGQVLPDQPEIKFIRRQINGYVGFANLPKQWHRRSIKNGFSFNLLCVGPDGIGKTTLMKTLFNNDDIEANLVKDYEEELANDQEEEEGQGEGHENQSQEQRHKVKIKSYESVIEENGVKLNLNVIDTEGFGDFLNNDQKSWDPIIKEIDSRFDQYLDAENKINRHSINDKRIHACLYFIEPTGHYLKPLDLKFMQSVYEKCNLIPVIAKSDILTDEEILSFKKTIMNQLIQSNIELFKPPIYSNDDAENSHLSERLFSSLPYAVIGSNDIVENYSGNQVRGRSYPWGVIEVDNDNHSDFNLLKNLLIKQFMEELKERTSKILYENYRSSKLAKLGIKQDNSVFKEFDPISKQQEEKTLHEAKLAKLEIEMKTVFQQKVSEKEKKLQKSETELFARHKEMKEKLTKQLKALEDKKKQLELSINSASPNVNHSPVPTKKKGFLR
ncbi:Cdc3p [Saccharomyces cerevisiae YJM1478]|nr:Cdc3p [Saccharomyces cerevisiae YJM1478]CAI4647236.1 AGK_G0038130.mRNA.1.CDS.1 [Saccharomyces cerevisiae]CAI4991191.1 BTE_HP_G0049650.mRNA.1.CDS.1 [Saccharomyces cerevisiae]CAI5297765.1 ADM_HP2_G0034840.mRNA.1.CDS.1 [Saccharomyces cerevisiae]CAI6623472.1 ADM_HP2_G0034840.mRNA.1.CDS.1 [Saccharomyces cerevisiae]